MIAHLKAFTTASKSPYITLLIEVDVKKKTDILGICQAERVVAKKINPILKFVENSLRHSI